MKIRNGFVSNSSSSSFVAVYVEDNNIITRFLKKFGYEEEEISESEDHEDLEHLDHGMVKHIPSGLHIHASYGDIHWIGLDIEDLLAKDMRVSECKDIVCKQFADIGISLKPGKLRFKSGECSSG